MQNDKAKFKIDFKKRLYNFVLRLIAFLDKLPKDRITQVMVDQLMRSGTSIIGNYIEAQASSSRKDFTNFFNHSLKSTNESKLWLAILRDSKRASVEEVDWFLKELEEVGNIFGSSILKLRGRK
ncbi:MAG: four helix bundle protein [Candidatus Levybacteria bacterium]|nr:four helix bundle protein [Candidatus Levybacteria bacterium]MBI2190165.1 four helix bundle protein [Candidatus Levybacteria bacterium]MBI2622725.1 four helix bundle protein [Candidatus Levybacteria bacterium]MBI3070200.1 four helix bundle protein [Candidatus Levybacteria bacterium]MBI3093194.1 four helix bundle protein [Candidatus Levybacteria bacterium]